MRALICLLRHAKAANASALSGGLIRGRMSLPQWVGKDRRDGQLNGKQEQRSQRVDSGLTAFCDDDSGEVTGLLHWLEAAR